MPTISLARTDEEIQKCFAVMVQLRPHLVASEFIGRIRLQEKSGYTLAYLSEHDEIKCVAGFRISECLAYGKFMYVDDLITDEAARSKNFGQQLFNWLVEKARTQKCEQFHLDSGVHRFAAHRFYLRNRMDITSHHFGMKL